MEENSSSKSGSPTKVSPRMKTTSSRTIPLSSRGLNMLQKAREASKEESSPPKKGGKAVKQVTSSSTDLNSTNEETGSTGDDNKDKGKRKIVKAKRGKKPGKGESQDVDQMEIDTPSMEQIVPQKKAETASLPTSDFSVKPKVSKNKNVKPFSLPPSYELIEELFNALEISCSYFEVRKQLCIFEKIRAAIESTARRTFTLQHLAKIKTIFPEGFQLKGITQSKEFKIVILRVPEKLYGTEIADYVSSITLEDEIKKRRELFHARLFERVSTLHQEFLENKKLPKQKGEPTSWHPNFPLESLPGKSSSFRSKYADIEEYVLPKQEKPIENKVASLLDEKNDIKTEVQTSQATTTATAESTSSKRKRKEASEVKSSKTTKASQSKSKKGTSEKPSERASKKEKESEKENQLVDPALREKIRQREQAIKLENAQNPPEAKKRKLLISRLPTLADNIRSFFILEKKGSLHVKDVLSKLDLTYKGKYSRDELQEEIQLLAELVPQFCKLTKLPGSTDVYMVLDRRQDYQEVKKSLQTAT